MPDMADKYQPTSTSRPKGIPMAPCLNIQHPPFSGFWPACTSVAALLLLLSGCATISDPPVDLASREAPIREQFSAPHAAGQSVSPAEENWILAFNDPVLVSLIDEAIEYNPDLRLAAAAWAESQARIRVARSYLSPQLDAVGGLNRSKSRTIGSSMSTDTRSSIEASASWELDLWGRVRASSMSAELSAEAARLQYASSRQSLAAAVVDAWILAIQANEKLLIDLDLLESEQRTAKITNDKVDAGVGTQLESALVQANVALAQASVTADHSAIAELTKALEALLGRYPSAELEIASTLPSFPGEIALGVPSQLLDRRPDIVAADRMVASAFYWTESAKAAKLPSLMLTGSIGAVLDPTDEIWSIGANLLAPIFNGGRLDAQVEIANAQQEQALAIYVRTAINAFREVENSLSNEQYLSEREIQLQLGSEHLKNASRIGENRYAAGILSIVDLMTIRRQDFLSRVDLLQVQTDRLRQRLALYRALGGSFDEHEALEIQQNDQSKTNTENES